MPKKTITPRKPNPSKQQIIPRADQKPRPKVKTFKPGGELSSGVK
jgi:hypothetical protein